MKMLMWEGYRANTIHNPMHELILKLPDTLHKYLHIFLILLSTMVSREFNIKRRLSTESNLKFYSLKKIAALGTVSNISENCLVGCKRIKKSFLMAISFRLRYPRQSKNFPVGYYVM